MSAAAPLAPAERLARILALLCRTVAGCHGRGLLAGPLVILIWARLRRLAGRITRLAARIEAGTPPARPRARTARPKRPKRPPPPFRLPRGRAWLIRLVPGEAAGAASQLRHLLAEPDMAALLAADPRRMGRLLRPLCQMLGVAPPPEIAQPAPAVPSVRESVPALAASAPQAPPPPRPLAPASVSRARPTACGPPPARIGARLSQGAG